MNNTTRDSFTNFRMDWIGADEILGALELSVCLVCLYLHKFWEFRFKSILFFDYIHRGLVPLSYFVGLVREIQSERDSSKVYMNIK